MLTHSCRVCGIPVTSKYLSLMQLITETLVTVRTLDLRPLTIQARHRNLIESGAQSHRRTTTDKVKTVWHWISGRSKAPESCESRFWFISTAEVCLSPAISAHPWNRLIRIFHRIHCWYDEHAILLWSGLGWLRRHHCGDGHFPDECLRFPRHTRSASQCRSPRSASRCGMDSRQYPGLWWRSTTNRYLGTIQRQRRGGLLVIRLCPESHRGRSYIAFRNCFKLSCQLPGTVH